MDPSPPLEQPKEGLCSGDPCPYGPGFDMQMEPL